MSRLSGLVIFFLLARALEPADFGIVAIASSVTVLAGVLMEQGLHQAVVREEHPSDAFLNTAYWSGLGVGCGVALLTAASAPLAAHLLDDPRLLPLILALAPLFILSSVEVVPAAVLVSQLNFAPLVRRRILATVVGGTAAAVVAHLTGSYWALVLQSIVSAAVSCVMISLGSPWRPRRTFSRCAFRRLRAFGSRLFGLNVLYTLQRQDRLLIGAVLGPAELGLYALGTRVSALASELVAGAIGSVALPTFSRLREQEGGETRLTSAYLIGTRTLVALGIPLMIGLAVTSDRLIPAIFGSQWSASTGVVAWLALGGVAGLALTFDNAVLLSLNRAGLELRLTICTTAVLMLALGLGITGGVDRLAMCVAFSAYAGWAIHLSVLVSRLRLFTLGAYGRSLGPVLFCGALSGVVSKIVEGATRSIDVIPAFALTAAVLFFSHLAAVLVFAPSVVSDLKRTASSLQKRRTIAPHPVA